MKSRFMVAIAALALVLTLGVAHTYAGTCASKAEKDCTISEKSSCEKTWYNPLTWFTKSDKS